MSNCTSLPGPLAQGIDLERQCQPGASGRYVYVFIEGRSGDSQLDIWEFQMYDDPGMYVHSVNTSSETHACRTPQPPAHVAHAWMVIEWALLACTNYSPGTIKVMTEENRECKMFPIALVFFIQTLLKFYTCSLSNDILDINEMSWFD